MVRFQHSGESKELLPFKGCCDQIKWNIYYLKESFDSWVQFFFDTVSAWLQPHDFVFSNGFFDVHFESHSLK